MKDALRRLAPRPLWRSLQRLKRWRSDAPFRVLRRQGWVAARKDDFYSPLPVMEDLLRHKDRWCRPSAMAGVRIDLDAMRRRWLDLHEAFSAEYDGLPSYEDAAAGGFGVGFTKADARTLYYMVRSIRPRRFFEVGAGLSTYYSHLARRENRRSGDDTQMTCVDPFAREALGALDGVRVVRDEVQNLPASAFAVLEDRDILFIDSSHAAKIDSDVTFLMMEVLPTLAVGVYVHIHDIPFPYNFPHPPELYIFGREWPMFWNEPVVVQAFLQFNDSFEVVLSLPYVAFHDPELVARTIPDRGPEVSYPNVIASLWLRRVR